eukprot:6071523-Pleurochrysis_carterae.AAC.1
MSKHARTRLHPTARSPIADIISLERVQRSAASVSGGARARLLLDELALQQLEEGLVRGVANVVVVQRLCAQRRRRQNRVNRARTR